MGFYMDPEIQRGQLCSHIQHTVWYDIGRRVHIVCKTRFFKVDAQYNNLTINTQKKLYIVPSLNTFFIIQIIQILCAFLDYHDQWIMMPAAIQY